MSKKMIFKGNLIKSTKYFYESEVPMSKLYEDFAEHRRLRVFASKGLECSNPDCNHVGTRLILGKDKGGGLHWDIYTDDLVLMNIDHILPKKQGGSDYIKNLQPMCMPCNSKKGHQIVDNSEISSIVSKKERLLREAQAA